MIDKGTDSRPREGGFLLSYRIKILMMIILLVEFSSMNSKFEIIDVDFVCGNTKTKMGKVLEYCYLVG